MLPAGYQLPLVGKNGEHCIKIFEFYAIFLGDFQFIAMLPVEFEYIATHESIIKNKPLVIPHATPNAIGCNLDAEHLILKHIMAFSIVIFIIYYKSLLYFFVR